jgi:hypothetical protein
MVKSNIFVRKNTHFGQKCFGVEFFSFYRFSYILGKYINFNLCNYSINFLVAIHISMFKHLTPSFQIFSVVKILYILMYHLVLGDIEFL